MVMVPPGVPKTTTGAVMPGPERSPRTERPAGSPPKVVLMESGISGLVEYSPFSTVSARVEIFSVRLATSAARAPDASATKRRQTPTAGRRGTRISILALLARLRLFGSRPHRRMQQLVGLAVHP